MSSFFGMIALMEKLLISCAIIVILIVYNIAFNKSKSRGGYFPVDIEAIVKMAISSIIALILLLITAYVF